MSLKGKGGCNILERFCHTLSVYKLLNLSLFLQESLQGNDTFYIFYVHFFSHLYIQIKLLSMFHAVNMEGDGKGELGGVGGRVHIWGWDSRRGSKVESALTLHITYAHWSRLPSQLVTIIIKYIFIFKT